VDRLTTTTSSAPAPTRPAGAAPRKARVSASVASSSVAATTSGCASLRAPPCRRRAAAPSRPASAAARSCRNLRVELVEASAAAGSRSATPPTVAIRPSMGHLLLRRAGQLDEAAAILQRLHGGAGRQPAPRGAPGASVTRSRTGRRARRRSRPRAPSATTRPWSRMTTRATLPRVPPAHGRDTQHGGPAGDELGQDVPEALPHLRIEAVVGSSSSWQAGVAEQCLRQTQALPHALGIGADRAPGRGRRGRRVSSQPVRRAERFALQPREEVDDLRPVSAPLKLTVSGSPADLPPRLGGAGGGIVAEHCSRPRPRGARGRASSSSASSCRRRYGRPARPSHPAAAPGRRRGRPPPRHSAWSPGPARSTAHLPSWQPSRRDHGGGRRDGERMAVHHAARQDGGELRLRPAQHLHRRAVQQDLGARRRPQHAVQQVVRPVGGVGDAVPVEVEGRVVGQ